MPGNVLRTAELCRELGCRKHWFYRHRERLHAEGMPRPIAEVGHPRWDAASFYAWKGRHHPAAPRAAANDTAPPLGPDNLDAWRAALASAYGRKTA